MAKQYTKNVWADEVLADVEKYDVKNSLGEVVVPSADIELVTAVVTAGTPVDASRMNNIENGIDALDTLVSGNPVPAKAIASEITAGTEDSKYTTPKALKDAGVPLQASTAVGDFLVGNGLDWVRKTLAEVKAILGLSSLGVNGEVRKLRGLISNPQAVYAQRPQIVLMMVDAPIHIKRIFMLGSTWSSAGAWSGSIKYADDTSSGGFANATQIADCSATGGIYNPGSINVAVPASKYVYFELSSSPIATCKDISIHIEYAYD